MLWSLGLAAAAGIMAALLAIDEVMVRVMFTGLAAAAAALLLLLLTKLIDRERTRPAGLLGMSIVMVEFLLALGLIWIPLGSGSRVDESMAMSMLFAGMAGIADRHLRGPARRTLDSACRLDWTVHDDPRPGRCS